MVAMRSRLAKVSISLFVRLVFGARFLRSAIVGLGFLSAAQRVATMNSSELKNLKTLIDLPGLFGNFTPPLVRI